jgi:hypothetical protein
MKTLTALAILAGLAASPALAQSTSQPAQDAAKAATKATQAAGSAAKETITAARTDTAAGAVRTVEARATVTAIDQATRMVTLKAENGKELTTKVSDEVRNLAQVKVGDVVVLTYKEALAVSLGTGDATADAAAMAARAKPGEAPAGLVGQMATISAKVEAIDLTANTVTFKGPEGNTRTVPVKDPKNVEFLKKLKVGDLVTITYAEALAVAVQPAK